jgi:DNA-binding NarL/FixJ family response regulator
VKREPQQGGITVYVCDDVPELRALLRVVVEEDGMRVVGEAGDARTMLAELPRIDPDVVVLDLTMPGLDGLEAIPLVHAAAPRAQIVVFSGYAAQNMAAAALSRKASRYVEKGGDLARLCAAVREVAA